MSYSTDLIGKIERVYESSSEIEEAVASRIKSFAGGRPHVKMMCGPGYKLVDGACIRMNAKEIMNRRKAARKNARTTTAAETRGIVLRARTMARRNMAMGGK